MQSSSPTCDPSHESQVPVADQLSQGSSQNGDSVTTQETGFHYSREELVNISKLPASNVRPAFLKAECNNEATGLWSPSKHEKYNGWNGNRTTSTSGSGGGSSAGTRTVDPDSGKTRLGPQNPGNWIRGCDPKMQESKPVTDSTIQSNGNKTTSELSVPPGLRLTQEKRSVPITGRSSNMMHGDWRSEKHNNNNSSSRSDNSRFPNPEFDSRSRGNQRTSSFNKNADRNFSNHSHHQRNNHYDDTPEWMSEPTSKFEMMNLGGFDDDTRGSQEEAVPQRKKPVTSEPLVSQEPVPNERSITPDFERLMKDMLNFTEEDSVTEIPVTLPEAECGSKSSKWFGGRPEQQSEARRPAVQNDLMQILQRANISLNQVQHQQPHLPKAVQAKSLHEIEGGLRGDPSPGSDDKQAFNKLLDLLSRRGTGHQHQQQQPPPPQHMPFAAPPPLLPAAGRPSSFEIEEMNRQRKLIEAHTEHPELQQKSGRSFPPAFSMVPIQVIRNATASDRRGLHEPDMNTQPRAITGSAQSHVMQRPARMPASPFGHEFDMQRQAMMQQEMQRQRSANYSPVSRAPLSAQQMQQLQQLQMMNQQLHQLNPSQLQQTRGMSAAQIQQFLLRSAQH